MIDMESAAECYDRAKTLYKDGSLKEALRLVESALEHYPDEGRLWEMLGITHHALREFAQATSALETATMLAPLSHAAQIALASCYLVSKHLEPARSIYEHLASLPDVPTHLLPNLAAGLGRLGELHLALDVHRERAHREPDCDKPLFAVAQYMHRLGYPVELIVPIVQKALELAPDRILYRVDLALLLQQCGDHEQAYQLLTAVVPDQLATVHCPPRLHGLVKIFVLAGDDARLNVCESKLSEITKKRKVTGQ